MGKKATKKFAASGRLKNVIKARHSQQKWKKKKQTRKQDTVNDEDNSETDEQREQPRDAPVKTYAIRFISAV
jgi:hypothetical protein